MARKKQMTLKQLAEQLGVTVQTVSKALNGKPGMSEETRSLILREAETTGYRTKKQLQALASQGIEAYPVSQRRFLLVYSNETYNYNRLLLKGLKDRFAEFGHLVEPVLLPQTADEAAWQSWLLEHGVEYGDGLFIAPRLEPPDMQEKLMRLPMPKIMIGYPHPEEKVDSVVWDVYAAVYSSVRFLVRSGHSRLLYIGDTTAQRGFTLRWQAFQDALAESELETESGCGSRRDPASGMHHSVGSRSCYSDWLQKLDHTLAVAQPDGIICGIDEEIPLVYPIIRRHLAVPDSCSVIGFVNEALPDQPNLTRPLLPIRETGYRAADRMLWRLANPSQPYEHIRIRAGFTPGETWKER